MSRNKHLRIDGPHAIEQPVEVMEETKVEVMETPKVEASKVEAPGSNRILAYRRTHPMHRISYGIPGNSGIVVFDLSLFPGGLQEGFVPPDTIVVDCELVPVGLNNKTAKAEAAAAKLQERASKAQAKIEAAKIKMEERQNKAQAALEAAKSRLATAQAKAATAPAVATTATAS